MRVIVKEVAYMLIGIILVFLILTGLWEIAKSGAMISYKVFYEKHVIQTIKEHKG